MITVVNGLSKPHVVGFHVFHHVKNAAVLVIAHEFQISDETAWPVYRMPFVGEMPIC